MFIVDLAVPRDIEPEVSQLSDTYLYTVDDLQNTINENLDSRKLAARQAEEIIEAEVDHYLSWLRSQGAISTIKDYRQQAEAIREDALQLALTSIRNGNDPQAAMTRLAHLLTNKLIHNPSEQIRQAGADERPDLIAAARELFKLKS